MSRQGLIQGKYRHEDGLWDDMRVPANEIIIVPGPPLEPLFAPFIDDGGGSEGTYALWFDIGNSVWFNIQVPHTWKIGTDFYPHVHWSTDAGAGPGDINWELEYVDATPLTPFPPGSIVIPSNVDSVSGPYFHEVVGFPAPLNGAGLGLSTMFLCRLGRIPSLGGPDYGGLIALLEMDFHFQVNDMGSTGQWTKG